MDTNKLLRQYGWGEHPRFPEIAKRAAYYSKSLSEGELLAVLDREFKHQNRFTMDTNCVPIKYYGILGTDYDAKTKNQICTAAKLPVAIQAALMPDAHLGYALPIGGVIALDNAISPSFVGFDIGCRMHCSILNIDPDDFMKHREELANALMKSTSFGIGSVSVNAYTNHDVMSNSFWNEVHTLRDLKEHARSQLGSSGGGNHFADLMIGTSLKDWRFQKEGKQFVALVTHSGSRGTGHKLATYYSKKAKDWAKFNTKGIPNGYEWLPMDEGIGEEYFYVMSLMLAYAKANHELIHKNFTHRTTIRALEVIQNYHNFAAIENGYVVHRKGATPAHVGNMGIIPGSMGTASYIVKGLGNTDSLHSASHGAGRSCSRTQAKKELDVKAHAEHVKMHDILTIGVGPDESYQAYKNIERVMELQRSLVKPIARMEPKVVIMGDKSDDGD